MSKIIIIEGNSNDKDNVRVIMVKGERGYSAYDIAVQNGYTGTEEEWVESFLNSDNYYDKNEIDIIQTNQNNKINKKPYYFNSIAEMKSFNLQTGDMAITLGYYVANDGGGAVYKILNDNSLIDDGGSVHDLTNGLKATLIVSKSINIKQYGAKGDGITNDTTFIQNVITYAKTNNLKLIANKKDVFLINQSLDISNMFIDLNMATIKTNTNIDMLVLSSELYYTNIQNINIDCNSIANSGIKVTKGQKATFKDINILNVKTYGWYYLSGYEMLVNNLNIYGDKDSSGNIGLYNAGGDSNFTNIIIIDCEIAIYHENSFNYYTNIHAWIYRHINILSSIYFKINGGKAILENCYSDTYRYSIYQITSIPYLFINNFVCLYNHGILTPEILGNEHPYFMYCNNAGGNSLTRISNSHIDGYSNDILTYLTNLDRFSGEIITSLMKNCNNNVSFAPLDTTTKSEGVTVISSNINKVGKAVFLDGRFSMDTTDTKTFFLGALPYYFRPSHEIICSASYGSGNYNHEGNCYLYINPNGNVSVVFPNEITGTKYVKINQSFINVTEQ